MSRRIASLLGAGLLAFSAVSVAATGSQSPPHAWIDQPLPGAVLVVGPTKVTVHAASPAGIAGLRIFVDKAPVAELPTSKDDLVHLDWTWPPTSPGTHVLTVIALAVDGLISEPAAVAVTFVAEGPGATASPGLPESAAPSVTPEPAASTPGRPTPTPTRTPSPTRAPGPTPSTPPRPTAAPCVPAAPTPVMPAFDALAVNPVMFEWTVDWSACAPSLYWIEISNSDLFATTVQSDHAVPGDQTYWTADTLTGGTYWWHVRARGPGGTWGPFSEPWRFNIR